MKRKVTINCDMGEGYGIWKMVGAPNHVLSRQKSHNIQIQGPDEDLMPLIDLANVACGFHGGDPVVMHRTIKLAKQHGIPVGAHPSLPDREGFGRRHIDISASDLFDQLVYQIGALVGMLKAEGMALNHIKPHGYLWRMCEASDDHAKAIMEAVKVFAVPILVISGTNLERKAKEAGLPYTPEFYPDIHYNDDAKLMSILYETSSRTVCSVVQANNLLADETDEYLSKI